MMHKKSANFWAANFWKKKQHWASFLSPASPATNGAMLKKIVLFQISLFVAFLALMAKWLLTLSSYVVAPLMLYIFGCGIYTAYRQTWNQFFILLVAEFICFILFFGATAITEGIGRFSEWLAEL